MVEQDANHVSQFTVRAERAGDRLDRALGVWLGRSRAAVLRLLDAGAIRLNGRAVGRKNKGQVLIAGDVLSCAAGYGGVETPLPDAAMALDVLAEGAGWFVVNKPAGVAVRPHALNEAGTILNAIAAREPGVIGVGEGGLRSGVVHRLDNDTSGALLFATQQQAWLRLRQAFAEHRVTKRYRVLVHGELPDTGESVQALRVARHSPAYVIANDDPEPPGDAARQCSLAWRVVERFRQGVCLVEVDLHTGFLHQVRVMMHHLGHPVVGDPQYGSERPAHDAPRQMLHACSLIFEEIEASAPLPEDFSTVVDRLRAT